MADDPSNNVINNYKGVMLCSRPNEQKVSNFQKPFCGRVVPGEQLGVNPVKAESAGQNHAVNKKSAILNRHKKWLNQFKEHVHKTKIDIEQKEKQEEQKFRRIRQQGQADRERAKKMKEQYQQTATQVLNVLDDKTPPAPSGELTLDNLRKLDADNEKKSRRGEQFKKKGDKPLWAMTKDAAEQNEDKEVDQLLDFFEHNQFSDFSQDDEVKKLLVHLKDKIQNMKQEDNWKEKQADRLKEAKLARAESNDDKYSHFSGGVSEGRSVASEKTQKKLEQLRSKMKQPKDWDKHTASEKSSVANIEDRIAKNIADEVLRNYPHMRGVHSNTSIRKLLEAEAAKVMNEPICRPVITTVVREKQGINANTLPYLHRNPAI